MKDMKFVTLLGATGDVRQEMHEGRQWTVVPVVALVEGVIRAVNAPAPELVRQGLFSKRLSKWEAKPVFAGHPMRNGEPLDGLLPDVLPNSFGLVRNATADHSLRMEAWLDHVRCVEGTPGGRILGRATAITPKSLEVSVGAWVRTAQGEGTWTNGKRYAAEWIDWEPNHLALLDEGQRGACDVEMGCGTHRYAMRVAADGSLEEDGMDAEPGLVKRFTSFLRALMPRNWGDDEVKQELREALLEAEPAFRNGGEIVRWKNDVVIYCLYPPPPLYYDAPSMGPSMTYWQRAYTFDAATQKFSVGAERAQVEPTTHYEPYRAAQESPEVTEQPIRAACGCGGNQPAASAAQGDTMERKDRIAALVANPHNKGRSLKMLEAGSDDDLTIVETEVIAAKVAADKAVKDAIDVAAEATRIAAAVPATPAAVVAAAAPVAPIVETEEQVLARFPGIKSVVDSHRAAEAAQKGELVKGIRAASQAFTEEQLTAKSIDELKQLAALAKVEAPVDYSLRGVPRAATAVSDLQQFAPPDPYAKDLAAK